VDPLNYSDFIRDIPDWPKEGVIFKDITPLLADADAFKSSIEEMAAPFVDAGVTKVMGAEARGFLFGTVIAYYLNAGFVPARKPGKLPWNTFQAEYLLEYGSDAIEVHQDGIVEGDVVLIVDDVLATGGTAAAKAELVNSCGATLAGYSFFIELDFLNGRSKLDPNSVVHSLVHVE